MSNWIEAKDISQYQGNWQDTGEPIVIIKMSGGDGPKDQPLYFDSQAAQNYLGAIGAGKAVGGYHFAGGGDPITEADYFIRAMSPLAENDVMALDWEIPHSDPVGWCTTFVGRVHDRTGIWPLIYMDLATLNSLDWSPVLVNCGLWLADWAVSPNNNIPTQHTYVMHQYADGPVYDRDAWFGTLEEFNKYGYHTPISTPNAPATVDSSPTLPSTSGTPPAQTDTTSSTDAPAQPKPTPASVNPKPAAGTNIDGVIPVDNSPIVLPPVTVMQPTPSVVKEHTIDVVIRSLKTWLAAMVAMAAAGGLDITHLSAPQNIKVGGLSAAFTAILNIAIKLYNASKGVS